MQIIAKFFGKNTKKIKGHVRTKHKIKSLLKENIYPTKVNSFHNLTISMCPSNFYITAKALDGSIEAIKHKKFKIEGWMWHPERESPFLKKDIINIKRIFNV